MDTVTSNTVIDNKDQDRSGVFTYWDSLCKWLQTFALWALPAASVISRDQLLPSYSCPALGSGLPEAKSYLNGNYVPLAKDLFCVVSLQVFFMCLKLGWTCCECFASFSFFLQGFLTCQVLCFRILNGLSRNWTERCRLLTHAKQNGKWISENKMAESHSKILWNVSCQRSFIVWCHVFCFLCSFLPGRLACTALRCRTCLSHGTS